MTERKPSSIILEKIITIKGPDWIHEKFDIAWTNGVPLSDRILDQEFEGLPIIKGTQKVYRAHENIKQGL